MIRQSMPRINTLVSYHDTSVHCGAIYRAAGWKMDAITCGKDWRNASRPNRPVAVSVAPKVRWLRMLRSDSRTKASQSAQNIHVHLTR
jgi:hypothetical protein